MKIHLEFKKKSVVKGGCLLKYHLELAFHPTVDELSGDKK
jgi:hypothetical protein